MDEIKLLTLKYEDIKFINIYVKYSEDNEPNLIKSDYAFENDGV